jgi:hypothetical protein
MVQGVQYYQFKWMQHVLRMPANRLPRKLLSINLMVAQIWEDNIAEGHISSCSRRTSNDTQTANEEEEGGGGRRRRLTVWRTINDAFNITENTCPPCYSKCAGCRRFKNYPLGTGTISVRDPWSGYKQWLRVGDVQWGSAWRTGHYVISHTGCHR